MPDFIFKPKLPDTSIIKNLKQCKEFIRLGVMNPDYTPQFIVSLADYNRQYRSIFGPYFNIRGLNHSGQGNGEYRGMVSRMIAKRAHGCDVAGNCALCSTVPSYFDSLDSYLKSNQKKLRTLLRSHIHHFRRWFHSKLELEDPDDAYYKWVMKPHSKRKLRIKVSNESIDLGSRHTEDYKKVQFKGKAGELNDISKRRGTGDLGVHRTNATAYAFECLKHAMEGEYTVGRYTFRFVDSPKLEILTDLFDKLSDIPVGHVSFAYFSDDGVLGVNCKDGLCWFNTDIKQCDGSHFTDFLRLVEDILCVNEKHIEHPYAEAIHRAFNYLGLPLQVINQMNKKERVTYIFTSMRMYSGFAGTTICNNFCNLFIGFCLQIRCPDPTLLSREEFINVFELAAADAGYICHLQTCVWFEQLQFLKHSPVLDIEGRYVPTVNIGTYFRGFGTFYGDLPAKGNYIDTARAFVSDVVRSRLGWGNHPINHAFHHLLIDHDVVFHRTQHYDNAFYEKSHGRSTSFIPLVSFCRRYAVTLDELNELLDCIRDARVGDVIELPIVQRIHDVDYG